MYTVLNENVIQNVKKDSVPLLLKDMGADIKKIVLFGSCARGDYTADSDIDIAILISGKREDAGRYTEILAAVATELAMRYVAVVNFVCLSQAEFEEKKSWYPFYRNIEQDGEVLYTR